MTSGSSLLTLTGGNKDKEHANNKSVIAESSSSSSSWIEEEEEDDDEALLSQLLLHLDHPESIATSVGTQEIDNEITAPCITSCLSSSTSFNDKLDRMLQRFEEDILRFRPSLDTKQEVENWWNKRNYWKKVAKKYGFYITSSIRGSSSSQHISMDGFPKAFHTTDGKAHVNALVDLLGISRERAVRLTLASLRTIVRKIPITTSTTSSSSSNVTTTTGSVAPATDKFLVNKKTNTTATMTTSKKDTTPPSSSSMSEQQEETTIKLRSLLGTYELFHHVLQFHRQEFLSRLRIITECLRLEQESKSNSNDSISDDDNPKAKDMGRVDDPTRQNRGVLSHSCARILDRLDSRLEISFHEEEENDSAHSKSPTTQPLRRGIFQILLTLSTGRALPGLGGMELPNSARLLRGYTTSTSASNQFLGNSFRHLLESSNDEIFHAIRFESTEALLALLYDRIDGGVTRLDLLVILDAVSSSSSSILSSTTLGHRGALEFGMSGREYEKRMLERGGRIGGGANNKQWRDNAYKIVKNEVTMMDAQASKTTLDGLWALICAECMGLWRITNHDNGGGNDTYNNWVNNHPLFYGIADVNAATERTCINAQREIQVLWEKMNSMREDVRDRRGVAYRQYRMRMNSLAHLDARNDATIDDINDDYDDEDLLWGVEAPEGIALLSFSLLLYLASGADPTNEMLSKLGELGRKGALIANDDCAAFAYLHDVLESTIQNPIMGTNLIRKRNFGNETLIPNLLKRGAIEVLNYERELTFFHEECNVEEFTTQDLVETDAASVLKASIGREILSSTIRAYRNSLLTLQSQSRAVENVGMLSDLASVIYRNSSILCEQFWISWDIFCQRGGSDIIEYSMNEDSNDIEPMCFLLDASHSLATSTLNELKTSVSQNSIFYYLKPLSSFIHLIASLCASPLMVQSVLTTEFLPEGFLNTTMSVIASLATLIPSINESDERVVAEMQKSIRCATVVMESLSALAYLGGMNTRAWIRNSVQISGFTAPEMICKISFEALSCQKAVVVSQCSELSSSALFLFVDLLVGSDPAFQVKTCDFFASSNILSHAIGDTMMGFAPFVVNGEESWTSLAAMTILNCLSVNLARNIICESAESSTVALSYIQTIGRGLMTALDLLATYSMSSEVHFHSSKVQVATAEEILTSIVGTLVNLKQVFYLHDNEEVQNLAFSVRNDVLSALSSSTPLGQSVSFLATVTLSTSILKKTTISRDITLLMDWTAIQSLSKDDKYGAWGNFVTPKRRPTVLSNDNLGHDFDDVNMDLYKVSAIALSLMLVWGEHTDDLTDTTDDRNHIQGSLCSLLLSKASCSAVYSHPAIASLNVSNLNLISRLVSTDASGFKSNLAILSVRVIKMCLRLTSSCGVHGGSSFEPNDFRVALGDGSHIVFEVLLGILNKYTSDDISESLVGGMESEVLSAILMLETVAVSVGSQQEVARAILLGGNEENDWRLVDSIASCMTSTCKIMHLSLQNEDAERNNRPLDIRCLLACACLMVVSELWKKCRLSSNSTNMLDIVHPCGIITTHLTEYYKTKTNYLVANNISELIRCSLLKIMDLDKFSLNEMSVALVNQKSIMFDILSHSLGIITIEIMSRICSDTQGGMKFVEDLFESDPMECWKALLTTRETDLIAATSWLQFSRSVANWNISSFILANPPEEDMSCSSWCSLGSSIIITKDLSKDHPEMIRCSAHHSLCQAVALFSTSWAAFFEVVTANVIATRSQNEIKQITGAVVDCALSALVSMAESKMTAALALSSQGLIHIGGIQPYEKMCSLLMYSVLAEKKFSLLGDPQQYSAETMQNMIGRLHLVCDNVFAMTQLGSFLPSEQASICLLRAKLLALALALFSEFDRIPRGEINRDNLLKSNDLRIGFTDLAINALQLLQYVHSDKNGIAAADSLPLPSKFLYDFGSPISDMGASLQLLRVSTSLLLYLAPEKTSVDEQYYLLYSYGVNFAACLMERGAIACLLRHLSAASTVASLTHQAVQTGSSTYSVVNIHDSAVEIIQSIVSLIHSLTESGSAIVEILLLLIENNCFRTLIDNPLMKTAGKMWRSKPSNESNLSINGYRGYCSNMAKMQFDATSSNRPRPTSQNDMVHAIWREIISTFASLIRSVRCQSQMYTKADEHIIRQIKPVIGVAFDFLCTYEGELFSCFSCMMSEGRTMRTYFSSKGKNKPSSFSSSIQSSTFAFTLNLIKEAADISALFSEICKGDVKTSFSRKYSSIYDKILSTSLDLTKIASSFLGSIANARGLFLALSNVSTDMEPTSMFENPVLADGIPNARHEAICNAHFAHSCCIIATAQDFANSHTSIMTETFVSKDSSPEQSFQIHVNNVFISEIEHVVGYCLSHTLSVLSDTHPVFDSFTYFSSDEASRLDVAAVVVPGTIVAIDSGTQFHRRYLLSNAKHVMFARTTKCDRSTRSISVQFLESEELDGFIHWSRIVGMEDISKRKCIFEYNASPKSIGESDLYGPPNLGHLIWALKWCRHYDGLPVIKSNNSYLFHIIRCVADRAAVLLCTEVLTHDELYERALRDDLITRQVNLQLLDLFECADADAIKSSHKNESLASLIGGDIMTIFRTNLKRQLDEARLERVEEQRLWEQNHAGWGNTSLLGTSTKREGRRSPFRAIRKSTSSRECP